MSITNLTSPYSTPYQVSADDIDLIKIRSLETSPLTHEDLDDNFANLMNKVNALVDIIGGSSAAISVDGDGNVGIGTTNPESLLHIASKNNEDANGDLTNESYFKVFDNATSGLSEGRNGGVVYIDANYYLSSSDIFSVSGRGENKLTIKGSGNVGIGTTSPNFPLHINKSDSSGCWTQFTNSATGTSSNSGALVGIDSNQDFRINLYEEKAIEFYTSGTQRMRIHSDGNVGIGTTSPESVLEVQGKQAFADSASDLATSTTKSALRVKGSNNGSNSLWMGVETNNASPYIQGANGAGNTAIPVLINPFDGNVGIGTTNPDAKLDVHGVSYFRTPAGGALISSWTIGASTQVNQPVLVLRRANENNNAIALNSDGNSYFNGGNVGIGTTNPDGLLELYKGSGSTGYNHLRLITGAGGGLQIGALSDDANPTWSINTNTDEPLVFSGGTNEYMRIQSGNVGIGTTNPQSNLHLASALPTIRLEDADVANGECYSEINSSSHGGLTIDLDPGNKRSTTDLRINIDGSEKMRIDSSGNVGIGTTSPESELHVNGDIILSGETSGNQGTRAKIVHTSGAAANGEDSKNDGGLILQSNDNGTYVDGLTIDHNGHCGIGTTSPDAKLEVSGAGGQAIKITSTDTGDVNNPAMGLISISDTGELSLYRGSEGGAGVEKGILIRAADASGHIKFDTGGGASPIERMRIDSAGNVGIGTTNPGAKLHIYGTSPIIKLTDTNTNADSSISADSGVGSLFINADINNEATNSSIVLNIDGDEKVRIDSDGNVGIGTTDPDNELHIEGNSGLVAAKIKNTSSGDSALKIENSVGQFVISNQNGFLNTLDNTSGTPASRMTIDPSGNVGIGTTAPNFKTSIVHGADGNDEIVLALSSDDPGIDVGQEVALGFGQMDTVFSKISSNYEGGLGFGLKFYTGSNTYTGIDRTKASPSLTINSAGNVGIGTTNPVTRLHIASDDPETSITSSNARGITIQDTSLTEGALSVINFTTSNGYGSSQIGSRAVTNVSGSGVRSDIFFTTRNSDDTFTEKLVIKSNGNVGIGTTNPNATLQVVGSLSKSSGSFRIDHPVKPETHDLVHSFVEAPQADNIYRGKVDLVAGKAEVNIDSVAGMTEGTFVLLNREIQVFTSNESDWDAVRGKVEGNKVIIECQNAESTATVSWLVIGERQDKHMYDTEWTDADGKVIVEPLKPEPQPEYEEVEPAVEEVSEEPVAPVEESQAESDPEIITKEDGKEYIRIGDKDYEVLGKNEDGSLLLDDDTTNNG